MEAASTTSTDLYIPTGFELHNRFQGLGEDEEVGTSQLQMEDSEISYTKPSSSEPNIGSIRNLSLKSEATGLFPNGTLNTNKKIFPKNFTDPHKISAPSLKELGSLMGFGFPSSKTNCHQIFSELQKNHETLIIEDEEDI